jgi:prevent-host-death family protein
MMDDVKYRGESYVIVRHGEPAAAVVPVEVYLQWKRGRKELFQAIRSVQTDNPDADPDQVMKDVVEAQQAARRSGPE